MGDQLDFSKLLVWKLLLSISSLDDALDANYYADWDITYGDKRRGDSYLNTLIVMNKDDKDELDNQWNTDKLQIQLEREIVKLKKDIEKLNSIKEKTNKRTKKNRASALKITELKQKILDLQIKLHIAMNNENLTNPKLTDAIIDSTWRGGDGTSQPLARGGGEEQSVENKKKTKEVYKLDEEIREKREELNYALANDNDDAEIQAELTLLINNRQLLNNDIRPDNTESKKIIKKMNTEDIKAHNDAIQTERERYNTELTKAHPEKKANELTKEHYKRLEQINKEKNMYKYNNSDRVHTQDSHDATQILYKRQQQLYPDKFTHKDGYIQKISNKPDTTPHDDAAASTHPNKPDHTSGDLATKTTAAKVATEAAINKHVSHEALAAAKAHGEVAKHHAKELHAKGKAHLANAAHHARAAHKAARNSNHGSGADFKKKQNESNNLIYLEKAIDDEANEPSASTVTFEGPEYKKYGHQEEFISSLEERLSLLNGPLVGIVNEFYDTIDPLTLTYLNKLIATSIPLIDRIKLYIFLASLMPEFGEAFALFLETMNPMWLNIYTTSLNHNMQGLFYKHGDVLQTKRAKSLLKSKERTKMLKDGIKKSAFGIDPITQPPPTK